LVRVRKPTIWTVNDRSGKTTGTVTMNMSNSGAPCAKMLEKSPSVHGTCYYDTGGYPIMRFSVVFSAVKAIHNSAVHINLILSHSGFESIPESTPVKRRPVCAFQGRCKTQFGRSSYPLIFHSCHMKSKRNYKTRQTEDHILLMQYDAQ